jgi:hypothetical protein
LLFYVILIPANALVFRAWYCIIIVACLIPAAALARALSVLLHLSLGAFYVDLAARLLLLLLLLRR